MYVPQHFAMTPDQVRELLAGVRSADLVTLQGSGLVATFLPFLFEPDRGEHGALITHVARNNSQAREPVEGDALVIVHGAEHYVSPTWLPSLATDGQVVPTWNYVTVHAYGRLIVHDDAAWTEAAVRGLTAANDAAYSVDQVPSGYLERMLRAIVGVEIRLTRVEAKAKMSQNKRPEDVHGIIQGLRDEAADDPAILTASWMAEHSAPAAERRAALLAEVRRTRRPPAASGT